MGLVWGDWDRLPSPFPPSTISPLWPCSSFVSNNKWKAMWPYRPLALEARADFYKVTHTPPTGHPGASHRDPGARAPRAPRDIIPLGT